MRDVDAVLQTLAQEAGKTLSVHEVEGLVAEAREHLEESIQARVELGATAEEAEREAILAFGAAERVGREAAPRGPLVDRRFALWALCAVAYWLIFAPRSWPDWVAFPLLLLGLALHVGFWLALARARRPQWVAFAAIFGTLWLAFSVPSALDRAEFIRDNIAGGLARNRAWHALLDRKERSFGEKYARFAVGLDDRSPSRVATFEPDGTLKLFERPDRATAAVQWSQGLRSATMGLHYERAELAQSDARQAWLARTPWYGLLPEEMGRLFVRSGGCVGAFYLGTHFFAWVFGWALRRRRPRQGAAA